MCWIQDFKCTDSSYLCVVWCGSGVNGSAPTLEHDILIVTLNQVFSPPQACGSLLKLFCLVF